MNWMVTWIVYTVMAVSCPDPVHTPDEFGVTQPIVSVTLQACYDTAKVSMQKEFATKEEAEEFISRGKLRFPDSPIRLSESWAADWKLLEVRQ